MRRRNGQRALARALSLAPLGMVAALGACAQRDDGGVGIDVTPGRHEVADAKVQSARASLAPKSGSSASGTVTIRDASGEVLVVVEARGLTPGAHGIHVHESGDCSSPDAESAGPHYAGHGTKHGALEDFAAHAGDLGNLAANPDGLASSRIVLDDIELKDLVGRAIVVHAEEDDLTTQPAGGSGARVACGVIEAEE